MTQVSEAFKAAMIAGVSTWYARADLLDKLEKVIGRIEGKVTDGSISVDKSRNVRRQFSLSLLNDNNEFTWEPGGLIWLDKRIRLYIGLETPSGIEYASQGVFLLKSMSAAGRADGAREAYLSGGDKWRQFDGQPLGKFEHPTTIVKGVKVADAILQIAADAGETKFAFDACDAVVPYDLTFQADEPREKALLELAELPVFELYYRDDGFLRFTPKIRNLDTTPAVWTYDQNDPITLYAGGEKRLDDDGLYNKVRVVGGSTQTPIVVAFAENANPADPLSTVNIGTRLHTYNGGSPDPLITTQQDAQNRADYELLDKTQIIERQDFSCSPNVLHDAGDVIKIVNNWTATNDKYELLSFSVPLRPGSLMTGQAWRIRKVGGQ